MVKLTTFDFYRLFSSIQMLFVSASYMLDHQNSIDSLTHCSADSYYTIDWNRHIEDVFDVDA